MHKDIKDIKKKHIFLFEQAEQGVDEEKYNIDNIIIIFFCHFLSSLLCVRVISFFSFLPQFAHSEGSLGKRVRKNCHEMKRTR